MQRDWKNVLYDPAEKGTLSMLSAAATEQNVKRVVITSSVVVVELKHGKSRIGRTFYLLPLSLLTATDCI